MDLAVENTDISIERYELGNWATNSYLIVCRKTGKSVLVDVPTGDTLMQELKGRKPEHVLLTHTHFDHIAGLKELKDIVNVPVAVHAADEQWMDVPPDIYLDEGDVVKVGALKIDVLHTPGHTPGSLCFLTGKHLIAGDTIFPGGPGKTRDEEEFQQIIRTIKEKILVLPDDTGVYPGHGLSTLLKKEKEEFAIFLSRPHDPKLHGDITWLGS